MIFYQNEYLSFAQSKQSFKYIIRVLLIQFKGFIIKILCESYILQKRSLLLVVSVLLNYNVNLLKFQHQILINNFYRILEYSYFLQFTKQINRINLNHQKIYNI
ncbi:transmembrane protein, putative (macronuclear) [Tetrahymena thermophila SB210]|uniref:Transmembrane protein, putative n=1 Tax=Tetrahymena thermophila (strain SB210) TaxID=312017 RepID=W7XFX8_TETTS|nr:transmembrane protein, putative [Tetrahymena thermophila SB210]EWS72941.1 transmembrane protein, putative [Tetrahymena thermophila SB210]|eukprot:XP_012654508.1 transmembrane protein, putative [Tetrahymena thermophila SB210]